jgi:hypothetical protein
MRTGVGVHNTGPAVVGEQARASLHTPNRTAELTTDSLVLEVQIAGRDRGVCLKTDRPDRRELTRAYLSPRSFSPRDDRRYKTQRWKRTRLRVLNRDLWICRIAPGCPVRATVADHVIAVYPGMPDTLFFGMHNLRAGCQGHNKARGFAPEVSRGSETSGVVTRDYSK